MAKREAELAAERDGGPTIDSVKATVARLESARDESEIAYEKYTMAKEKLSVYQSKDRERLSFDALEFERLQAAIETAEKELENAKQRE